MSIIRSKSLYLILIAAVSVLLVACKGVSVSSVTTSSYSGPGSKWDFVLSSDGTFSIDHRPDVGSAIDMTVNGTFVRLASGFMKMTVTSGTGTNAPSPGDIAMALEVPGYALMVKPLNAADDQMIMMVNGGTCPTVDINANWVMVNVPDGDDVSNAGRDLFGTFNYDVLTSVPSLPNRFSLVNPTTDLGAYSLGGGSCSNGVMLVGNAVMYLTSNGAIGHIGVDTPTETDDQFVFGLQEKAIADVNNFDGNYAGLGFDGGAAAGPSIFPVSFSCTAGICGGNLVTDIDTNALSTDSVTVALTGTIDSPNTGLITGTITDDGSGFSGNLACMADIDAAGTGKRIISCVGQAPGDNTSMFNMLMVSK